MDPIKAVRKIQSYGMEVSAGFIVGNDNEPEDIHDKIFDFCQEAGIPRAMVGLLTALKGSELYERLKQERRLRQDTEGDNTHTFHLNFNPLEDDKYCFPSCLGNLKPIPSILALSFNPKGRSVTKFIPMNS